MVFVNLDNIKCLIMCNFTENALIFCLLQWITDENTPGTVRHKYFVSD